MTVDRLPGQVREFAHYLDALLARLDQGAGWCGVFWQRDPEGMQACLDGREMPPWDVVEALLQDLAAEYGHQAAGAEAERARAVYAAALVAYDASPGGRDALGDRFDVMLREQRYAAERQAELGRLLASATTQEEADALRLDLAWARDDHERATRRCAELRSRMADLDRRATAEQGQATRRGSAGEAAVFRAGGGSPSGDVRSGTGEGGSDGPGDPELKGRGQRGYEPGVRASVDARSGDMGPGDTGPGGVRTDGRGASDAWPDGPGHDGGGGDGRAQSQGFDPYGSAPARGRGHGWGDEYGSNAAPPDGQGSYDDPAFDGRGLRFDEQESGGRDGSYDGGFPSMPRQRAEQPGAEVTEWRAADRGAAGTPGIGDTRREDPDAAAPQWSHPTGTPDPEWVSSSGVSGADWSHPTGTPDARRQAPADAPGSRRSSPAGTPDPEWASLSGVSDARRSSSAGAPDPEWVSSTGVSDPQQSAFAGTPPPRWSTSAGAPDGQETAPEETAPKEPEPKQRRRRRGSARFAGMVEQEAAPVVVPPAVVPDLPAAPVPTGRTPRGARFAGVVRGRARTEPQAEPLDAVDRRETTETVERLVRLRGEGRSGEAHALLAEIAYWPAARYPLLAAEMQRTGLRADWVTLLWEAASLPADRLVAAADALVAAGRGPDAEQILRQGVARPAAEIGRAVLALAAEGRRREVRALLDAYVSVRTPEEAARSAAPDPPTLVPLLVEAARGVSDQCHWDLVHALRVAGFPA
ncbi:hypothetical protein [Streptomyces sp. ALI-76-A]|uniref:hypothetical protein n=1 Tax=Streptomyces sp. ALI-76-A TaxID=3025736 RepID=UPI00256F5EF6|nr:hypothetical protein [Streptomyces sp. ALI-76-A]MDL5204660.1 hypothetical protein [Streptomyces sp. ALI-76-A]